MIDLRNFVNININYFASTTVSGSRDTAVLISGKTFDAINSGSLETIFYKGSSDTVFSSEEDFVAQAKGNLTESQIRTLKLFRYIQCFFINGGKKLHFIEIDDSSLSQDSDIISAVKNVIAGLPNEEIAITSTFSRKIMQAVALDIVELDKYQGINEKLIITNLVSFDRSAKGCIAVLPSYQPTETLPEGIYYTAANKTDEEIGYLVDANKVYTPATGIAQSSTVYYIMKYVGNDAWQNSSSGQDAALPSVQTTNLIVKYGPAGTEMSLAAYLTRVNVYNSRIQDYCYTKENLSMIPSEVIVGSSDKHILAESVISDDNIQVSLDGSNLALIDAIKLSNYNCNVEFPSYGTVVVGGNMVGGRDLINNYIKIIMSQTLTQRILGVLIQKVRYTQSGINMVANTIVDELNRYKDYGYLTNDKIYTGDDKYDPSGKYLLIRHNSPLAQGYTFTILPFSSLTEEDRQKHKLPKIYLIVADSYSIREIDIEGIVY